MLSLVDLKDFAEICRALEEFAASRTHLDGTIVSRCGTRSLVRDDMGIAENGTTPHRFCAKASAPK